MKPASLIIVLFLCTNLLAQKDTFDLVAYSAPAKWTKDLAQSTVSYTVADKGSNNWCRIIIVKSAVSKGSIDKDFESEWKELIIKSYAPKKKAEVNPIEASNGWKIKSGSANFKFNNKDAVAMLTTASGFNRCASIVVITNTQGYLKDVENLLTSIDLIKPELTAGQKPGNNAVSSAITGTWGVSNTVASGINMHINEGSMITQYTFNANGTYSFYVKTFRYQMDKLLLTRETGTYQVNGNNLTVTPQLSVVEAWTRKDGTDNWGKLLSKDKRELEKTTYTFSAENFGSGMVLILKAGKPTKRDGNFNNSAKDAWFYPSKQPVEFIKLPISTSP